MVNQGILKTLEALVALFMVLAVLAIFIPREPVVEEQNPAGFLNILGEDTDFRNCMVAKNSTCINQTIQANLETNFDFIFNLSDQSSTIVTGMPAVKVFSEALYITGNVTNSSTTILRVFYWNKAQ